MLSKLLKLLMNFKKVQNQTSNEATINQKVNGNLKRKKENTVTYDLAAARLVKMSEHSASEENLCCTESTRLCLLVSLR